MAGDPAHRIGDSQNPSQLSVHCSFVVQFRTASDVRHGTCDGRVEHISSGQIADFSSVDDLLTFIERVLTKPRPGE